MIQVLIADDHAIVRDGLRHILDETSDIRVAGEARSADEAVEKAGQEHFDVMLLDISMPERSGLDILEEVRHLSPTTQVLILTMHPEEQFAVKAIKAGAAGYLTKDSASDELIEAIRKVAEGRRYVSLSVGEQLALALTSDVRRPLHERLSEREYQVLCMIGRGNSIKDIAEELQLSAKTVRTYQGRILTKMGMHGNLEIVHYVVKNQLTD